MKAVKYSVKQEIKNFENQSKVNESWYYGSGSKELEYIFEFEIFLLIISKVFLFLLNLYPLYNIVYILWFASHFQHFILVLY